MSSNPPRKVIRTYSHQRKRLLYDEQSPAKRRRVEIDRESHDATISAIPPASSTSSLAYESSAPPASSPRDSPVVFSDEPPGSSPPSSPAPHSSPPRLQQRRPVFGIFKKHEPPKLSATKSRSERNHHAHIPQKTVAHSKRMVQMQLDLVGQHRKACKTCGMEYIPSNAEDAALHRRFHAMNVGGVDFAKPVLDRFRKNEVWSGSDGSFIAVIGRRHALALRNRAQEVLKVVNTELAAVAIPDGDLWGQASRTLFADAAMEKYNASPSTIPAAEDGAAPLVDRFKIYLYFRGHKCVGACLAERIWEAFTVLDQHDAAEQNCRLPIAPPSSSISISTASEPAVLGISRIWTSNQYRKQGIASRLLDTARSSFLYGLTVEKEQVAFSQPTDSGGNLARRWFGRHAGWHVYID